MKKRMISAILCITMLSAMLVGCGAKKEETPEKKNEERRKSNGSMDK